MKGFPRGAWKVVPELRSRMGVRTGGKPPLRALSAGSLCPNPGGTTDFCSP